MSFGEMLKNARERCGYTQQQVANKMEIDKSTYCGYETGKRQPDVQKIKQLSCFLNTSADDLLETGFKKSAAPIKRDDARGPAKQQLLNALSLMSDDEIRSMLDVIESVKRLKGQ